MANLTKFKVNWRVTGLVETKDPAKPSVHDNGDIVSLDLDDPKIALYVKRGLLSPLKPAAPATGSSQGTGSQGTSQQKPPEGNFNFNFSKMTKQELVDFAKAQFKLELDVNSTKDELLAAIAEAEAAAAEAAEASKKQ